MIKINSKVIREQTNFWNHCLFHPTDAIEDSWGKRILDKMAEDGAVKTVRVYAMLEDIVYLDENDELQYDFRASDLRLDYMLEKGYDLIISYAGMPDCISSSTEFKSCESKNSTRYKGKLFNTSMPKDLAVWEEVCYQYTKHNIERYGIDVVSRWHCHCFNEPDVPGFFLREL
jgi:xylan 1,4-beta-xylosidase